MDYWVNKENKDFISFFGLRDFYSLVKDIWITIDNEKAAVEDANKI